MNFPEWRFQIERPTGAKTQQSIREQPPALDGDVGLLGIKTGKVGWRQMNDPRPS